MASPGAAAMWGANWAQQQLNALLPIYQQGYEKAEDRLTRIAYYPSARDLKDYYTRQKRFQVQGMNRANALIGTGMKKAGTALSGGYGDALQSLQQYYGKGAQQMQQGVGAWQGFLDQANRGYGMYQNALGLGGAGGREAAQQAF